jgi:hypothetical protein
MLSASNRHCMATAQFPTIPLTISCGRAICPTLLRAEAQGCDTRLQPSLHGHCAVSLRFL